MKKREEEKKEVELSTGDKEVKTQKKELSVVEKNKKFKEEIKLEKEKELQKVLTKYERTGREVIPTDIIPLDMVLGGGFTRGDLIEVSSEAGAGKSTLLLYLALRVIKKGLRVVYLDIEGGVKESLLIGIGLASYLNKEFYLLSPTTYTEIEEILTSFIESEIQVDVIVIDSVAAISVIDIEKESINKIRLGLKSHMDVNFLTKYKSLLAQKQITMFLINQMRVKLNFNNRFNPSSLAPGGGNALEFYPDVKVHIKKGQRLKAKAIIRNTETEIIYGMAGKIFTTKNRHTRPEISLPIHILFGKGVSNNYFLLGLLEQYGALKIKGGGHVELILNEFDEVQKGRSVIGALKLINANYEACYNWLNERGAFVLYQEDNIVE